MNSYSVNLDHVQLLKQTLKMRQSLQEMMGVFYGMICFLLMMKWMALQLNCGSVQLSKFLIIYFKQPQARPKP